MPFTAEVSIDWNSKIPVGIEDLFDQRGVRVWSNLWFSFCICVVESLRAPLRFETLALFSRSSSAIPIWV
jgi:hypothetical protein